MRHSAIACRQCCEVDAVAATGHQCRRRSTTGVPRIQSTAASIIMAALCADADIIFLPYGFFFYLLSFFFSSPNLSGRRVNVCHTSTNGVALV